VVVEVEVFVITFVVVVVVVVWAAIAAEPSDMRIRTTRKAGRSLSEREGDKLFLNKLHQHIAVQVIQDNSRFDYHRLFGTGFDEAI
jgi:hypothetical protein